MKRYLFLILPVIIVLLDYCTTTTKITNKNLSSLYKTVQNTLNPKYVVYHESDSISKVYFKIETRDLLYTKKESDEKFLAKVKLKWKLFESYESKKIVDSSFTILTDRGEPGTDKNIIGHFEFKAETPNKYVLQVMATDIYRRSSKKVFVEVDKTNPHNRQNFMLRDDLSGLPLFDKHIPLGKTIRIKCNNPLIQTLYGRHYNRNFPLAVPPFAIYNPKSFEYDADSLFVLSISGKGVFRTEIAGKGIYHLQTDTTNKLGLTLFHLNENFPTVKLVEELILPLRYITTRKEFDELLKTENQKKQLDYFWLNVSSNPDRARELIKQYYARVQDANRFLTSYTEGWRTDRGMVYIVFGHPNVIYKSSNSESWVYGEENNFMSVNFNFTKVSNPFSDNDYILARSPIYKSNYYKAVDSWREGRIFVSN